MLGLSSSFDVSIGRCALFRLPHAVTTIAVVCRDRFVFSFSGVLQRAIGFSRGDWAGEGDGRCVLVVSASCFLLDMCFDSLPGFGNDQVLVFLIFHEQLLCRCSLMLGIVFFILAQSHVALGVISAA